MWFHTVPVNPFLGQSPKSANRFGIVDRGGAHSLYEHENHFIEQDYRLARASD